MAPKKTARLLAVAGVLVAALIVFVALRQPTSTSEDAEELVVFHPPTTLDARLGANKGRLSAGECGANVFVTDEDSDAVGSVIACAHSAHDLGRQYCGSTSSQGVVGLNWPCGFAPESMIILVRKPGYSQLRNARFVANPDEVTHVAVTMTQTDYRLQGRVEDIFGGPVEGAWIWATCKGDGSTWGSAWDADAVSSAVSSQAGEFSLGFTHNCKLDELLVKAEGYANYSQKMTKDDKLIVAKLAPASVIRGQVIADGQPVEGASVVAVTGRFGETEDLHASSDPDGNFEIHGVPPGQWIVRAQKHDAFGTALDMVKVDMGDSAEDVVVRLVQMSSVDISVKDIKDGFCDQGQASLWPVSEVGLSFGAAATIPLVKDHHSSFRAVPDGKYRIKVRCEGYALVQSEEFELYGAESKQVEIQMPEGQSLAGQVIDTLGQPVPDCLVNVGGAKQQCDENGRFNFWLELTYPATLMASGPGDSSATTVLEKHPGDGVTVQLSPRSKIYGKVISSGGLGIPRLSITTSSTDDGALDCLRTAADGSFSCKYVGSPGSWAGIIEAKRGDVVLGRSRVSSDDEVIIQTNAMDIEGQVVRESGEPAEFAYVNLFEEIVGTRRSSIASVQADAEGRFLIGGALSGRIHYAYVVAPDGASVEVEVDANPMSVVLPNSVSLILDVQGCGESRTGHVGVYREGQMFPTIARPLLLGAAKSSMILGNVSSGTYEVRLEVSACGVKKVPHVVENGQIDSSVQVVF